MPIIHVIANTMSLETKRELTRELTEAAARILDMAPEKIVVILDSKSPEDIGVAGTLLVDRKPPAAS